MLTCETVGWAKPYDVIDVITEGVYLVGCHVELPHVRAMTQVFLRG